MRSTTSPDWLRALAPLEWFDRYVRLIEDARLPTKPEERQQYAEVIGADGLALLEAVYAAEAPAGLRELEAVQILRRVWVHQYETVEGLYKATAGGRQKLIKVTRSIVFVSTGKRRRRLAPRGKTSIRWTPTHTPYGQETNQRRMRI
jgi:hypothetical protein